MVTMTKFSDDGRMPDSDEFAEFDTDEATFDAMLARAEPAEIVAAQQTVIVEQDDDTRFTVNMPAGVTVSVATSRSESVGGRGKHSRQRRPAYRRSGSEALAS